MYKLKQLRQSRHVQAETIMADSMYKLKQSWHRRCVQSWHRYHVQAETVWHRQPVQAESLGTDNVQAETVLAQPCTSRNSPGIDCMYKLKQSWHRNVQAETVLAHCIYKLKQSWHTQRVQADSPETETDRTQTACTS